MVPLGGRGRANASHRVAALTLILRKWPFFALNEEVPFPARSLTFDLCTDPTDVASKYDFINLQTSLTNY